MIGKRDSLAAKVIFIALNKLAQHDGKMKKSDLLSALENEIEQSPSFETWDKETLKHGKTRWLSSLEMYSHEYVKGGLLIKNRGIWSITNKGRDALKKDPISLFNDVRDEYKLTMNHLPEEVIDNEGFSEGSTEQILVNAYERNPKARRQCIKHYGTSCFICGFNFMDKYGKVADGFIHVHHLRPLSKIGENYTVDPVKDLRPVCPNCHAVLHKRDPVYSIEDVKNFLL